MQPALTPVVEGGAGRGILQGGSRRGFRVNHTLTNDFIFMGIFDTIFSLFRIYVNIFTVYV